MNRFRIFQEKAADSSYREVFTGMSERLVKEYAAAVELIVSTQKQQIEELSQFKLEAIDKITSLEAFSSEVERKYLSTLAETKSSSEFQSMKETLSRRESKNNAYKKEISDLKRDFKAQEEQLLRQSVEIDELYALVDRYENIVEKDKNRGSSKCEFATLVRQLNEGIDKFHRCSEEV